MSTIQWHPLQDLAAAFCPTEREGQAAQSIGQLDTTTWVRCHFLLQHYELWSRELRPGRHYLPVTTAGNDTECTRAAKKVRTVQQPHSVTALYLRDGYVALVCTPTYYFDCLVALEPYPVPLTQFLRTTRPAWDLSPYPGLLRVAGCAQGVEVQLSSKRAGCMQDALGFPRVSEPVSSLPVNC